MSNEKPEALELADIFENLAHPTGTRHRAAKTMPDGRGPALEDVSLWFSADAHASGGLAAATRRAIVRAAAEIGRKQARKAEAKQRAQAAQRR